MCFGENGEKSALTPLAVKSTRGCFDTRSSVEFRRFDRLARLKTGFFFLGGVNQGNLHYQLRPGPVTVARTNSARNKKNVRRIKVLRHLRRYYTHFFRRRTRIHWTRSLVPSAASQASFRILTVRDPASILYASEPATRRQRRRIEPPSRRHHLVLSCREGAEA